MKTLLFFPYMAKTTENLPNRIREWRQRREYTLAELAQESAASELRLHTLSEVQERELVSDVTLLLVAVCALNQWPIEDMVRAAPGPEI